MREFGLRLEFGGSRLGRGLGRDAGRGGRPRRGAGFAGWRRAGVTVLLAVAGLLALPGLHDQALNAGLVAQEGAPAQEASGPQASGVADSVHVGDVVPVVVRVPVAPGERVIWPDTLPLAGVEAENAARVRARVDTLADGRVVEVGEYSVTPWRTGELELPELVVQVTGGSETPRARSASLPDLAVASVLPSDTAGLEPKPARGVLGPSWAWTTILALVLLVLAIVGLLAWWWRRRRGRLPEAVESPRPMIPPRDRALAALDAAREAGLVERGEMKEFYTRVTDAVRGYAAALDGTWGEDLTTTELLGRFRAQVGPGEAGALGEVLGPADRVKFARRVPDRDTALEEWGVARAWVQGFDWPPRRTVPDEEAA